MNYKKILCDANNLYDAYLASVKTSQWKETTQRVSTNYLREIFSLQDALENQTYRSSVENTFRIRERGKIRQISSLNPRDRIVRHVLCDKILMPEISKRIIYDNCASVAGRGISMQRNRFATHLRKYYRATGTNKGYVLFTDFSSFYDNVLHSVAKDDFLKLTDYDPYMRWLLDVIFENFKVDVSYMTDEEFDMYEFEIFNKLEYFEIDKSKFTGEKLMEKSVNIGDQLSQAIGIYYPHEIDNYVKTVLSHKFYGRYMDDLYDIHSSKDELFRTLDSIRELAFRRGLRINEKKTKIIELGEMFKFLQVRYTLTNTGKVLMKVNPNRATVMRRKLRKLSNKVQNGSIEYAPVEDMFKSWMGTYYKLLSKDTRLGMMKFYSDLFGVSVNVKDGKLIIF